MRNIIFLFSCFNILLISCEFDVRQPVVTNMQEKKVESTYDIFKIRDENSNNFLLLSFWLGMTSNEYNVITDSLINNNILKLSNDTIYFVLRVAESINFEGTQRIIYCTTEFILSPNFSDDKLIEIKLVKQIDLASNRYFGCQNGIFKLYADKYGQYIIERPEIEKYLIQLTVQNDKYYEKTHDYFRFIQYIWEEEEYYITITENYSILKTSGFPETIYDVIESYVIEYTSKQFFSTKLTLELMEKDRIEKEKEDILQKTKDLI